MMDDDEGTPLLYYVYLQYNSRIGIYTVLDSHDNINHSKFVYFVRRRGQRIIFK